MAEENDPGHCELENTMNETCDAMQSAWDIPGYVAARTLIDLCQSNSRKRQRCLQQVTEPHFLAGWKLQHQSLQWTPG